MHSTVLHANEAQGRAQEIRDARAGNIVMLEFPPFRVTIAIDVLALRTGGMQHEEASKVVVPLMQVQRKINIHRYIAVRTKGGGSLYTHAYPFRLTFGSTYNGVQCRSMDKIILVVDDKSLPALTYSAFYVGMSRVRTGDGLRVNRLQNHEEAPEDWRGRLKSLVPKVMVVQYMLKTSYENAHNLLKAMYREWDIDYDMRGHDKRMHRKGSKKSNKKEHYQFYFEEHGNPFSSRGFYFNFNCQHVCLGMNPKLIYERLTKPHVGFLLWRSMSFPMT